MNPAPLETTTKRIPAIIKGVAAPADPTPRSTAPVINTVIAPY
jgi:hypothetical protein